MSAGIPQQHRGVSDHTIEETTMENHYGPRGLHAELESGFERLLRDRRRARRTRRADGRRAR